MHPLRLKPAGGGAIIGAGWIVDETGGAMSVKLVVAVTDRDWYDSLRSQAPLDEVNFWSPSPVSFRALQPGELFLFKLHAPYNFIVGGGVFAYANTLPCSLAWNAFGSANGASSLREMRDRIVRYRRGDLRDPHDFSIGCRILTQPFFLPEEEWLPAPASWSPNIVTFKTYTTDETEGLALWERMQSRIGEPQHTSGFAEEQARFGQPTIILPRLGQGTFRVLVTDAYGRKCAVSGEKTLPALEAAHIRPYSEGGEHAASNGLLLRRDIHSLFDAGYVTVTPDYRFEVSRRIREEFENGRHYYELHGKTIGVPEAAAMRPDGDALTWHNEMRFR